MPNIMTESPRKTTAEPEGKREHENWRLSQETEEGGGGDIDTRPRRPRSIGGLWLRRGHIIENLHDK